MTQEQLAEGIEALRLAVARTGVVLLLREWAFSELIVTEWSER